MQAPELVFAGFVGWLDMSYLPESKWKPTDPVFCWRRSTRRWNWRPLPGGPEASSRHWLLMRPEQTKSTNLCQQCGVQRHRSDSLLPFCWRNKVCNLQLFLRIIASKFLSNMTLSSTNDSFTCLQTSEDFPIPEQNIVLSIDQRLWSEGPSEMQRESTENGWHILRKWDLVAVLGIGTTMRHPTLEYFILKKMCA